VYPARFPMPWVLYVLVALQKLLLDICSWWHEIQISAMLASVSSISGIPVLGRVPSCCTLEFTACFYFSQHSTAAGPETSPTQPSPNWS
jgi:hypothetical protein